MTFWIATFLGLFHFECPDAMTMEVVLFHIWKKLSVSWQRCRRLGLGGHYGDLIGGRWRKNEWELEQQPAWLILSLVSELFLNFLNSDLRWFTFPSFPECQLIRARAWNCAHYPLNARPFLRICNFLFFAIGRNLTVCTDFLQIRAGTL